MQLEVVDVDADEQERRLLCLLARELGLGVLDQDLEVIEHGFDDANAEALVDEEDLLPPFARLAVGADLLHRAELVVVDLLEILIDLLLLHVELSVELLVELLVADGLGLVALVDDDALAIEAVCD